MAVPTVLADKKFLTLLLTFIFRDLDRIFARLWESLGAGTGGMSGVRSYPCCSMEDMAMRSFDFSPLSRSSVGFERMFDLINDSQQRYDAAGDYPPYDIVRTGEETYRICLAIAGYKPENITIVAKQNLLTVSGRLPEHGRGDYLHRGISAQAFERHFSLADHVEVRDATYDNGLLQIDLVREVPEAMKPRTIKIRPGSEVLSGEKSDDEALRDGKTAPKVHAVR
jgi:molecular chaperone IbpA